MSKTWFITGASSGFGKALAETVLAEDDRRAKPQSCRFVGPVRLSENLACSRGFIRCIPAPHPAGGCAVPDGFPAVRSNREMARSAGFEPTTPAFGGLYSIQLSYERVAAIFA